MITIKDDKGHPIITIDGESAEKEILWQMNLQGTTFKNEGGFKYVVRQACTFPMEARGVKISIHLQCGNTITYQA